jgi:hypothetical protein
VRNVIEIAATALALDRRPDDIAQLLDGSYDSGKAVTEAKKSIPYIGRLYGYFSEHFAHLGGLASADWGARDLAVPEMRRFALLGFWNIDAAFEALELCTELVMFDYLPVHRRVTSRGHDEYEVLPFPKNPLNREE